MKLYTYPQPKLWKSLCQRPVIDASKLEDTVRTVVEAVKKGGDKALKELTKKFDGVALKSIPVSSAEFNAAEKKVSKQLKDAVRLAKQNIERFHSAQQEKEKRIETAPGVVCWRKSVPIEKAGLYIPGGSAPLFSTLLMLGVPAKIAGCAEIIVCTPPAKNGNIAPEILYTAKLIGIDNVYKAGGAQAIAAMCSGTETIPAVDKIFGPGNQYVTMAKMLAQQQGIAIDMPAGPSEVLVIADTTCKPEFVAADLLSQAEHGADSQVVLVCTDEKTIKEILREVEKQLKTLPRRKIAAQALLHSKAILLKNLHEAVAFSNQYAPEHLILAVENCERHAAKVTNAGSVFLGNYSCESAGDYASGTNHTLPTNGFARSYSGVSLDSFVKKITFQQLTAEGIQTIGNAIEQMAAAEQLDAHKNAVTVRLNAIKNLPEKKPPKFNPEKLLRENVKNAKPYSSARDEFSGKDKIFLDANENPFDTGYNRYPDPHQHILKEKIGRLKKIAAQNIFLGNGSDEAIDLVIRAFCTPGENKIIICPPTYGMYEVAAQLNDIKVQRVPLDKDFQLNVEAVLQSATPDVKMIFLCSPNNPTGNLLRKTDIKTLLKKFKGIVVLDEAYADFSNGSLLREVSDYPNLIVLHTFSKAWGLAGIRLGMAFASEEIISVLDKIKPPYNISALTQQLALNELNTEEKKNTAVNILIAEREKLMEYFSKSQCAIRAYPSDSNFLLVKFNDPKKIYNYLLKNGIVTRDRSSVAEGCLRITIGTPEENQKLIALLNRKP